MLLATAPCNFSTSQLQKVVRAWGVLYILTWKCSSRHNGVQFFHIATSKSGPSMQCFVHFDFEMCFSLQRRAIFHFSAQRPPPHPPLYRGYFSTQPTHKSLKNTAFRDFPNISRLWIFFLLTFAQLYLLSSDSTSLLCFVIFWLCCSALLFQLSILSEVRLLNFLRIYWYMYHLGGTPVLPGCWLVANEQCFFSMYPALYTGSMPTRIPPYAYADGKGCLRPRFLILGAYAGASAGFFVGWPCSW